LLDGLSDQRSGIEKFNSKIIKRFRLTSSDLKHKNTKRTKFSANYKQRPKDILSFLSSLWPTFRLCARPRDRGRTGRKYHRGWSLALRQCRPHTHWRVACSSYVILLLAYTVVSWKILRSHKHYWQSRTAWHISANEQLCCMIGCKEPKFIQKLIQCTVFIS